MSSRRVEVTEQRRVPVRAVLARLLCVVALGVDVVFDHALVGELGVTVGVGRAERAVLGDGDHVGEAGGVAVDGGGGGEDNVGDIVLGHGSKHAQGAEHIDAVVFEGDLARLADGLDVAGSVNALPA